MSAPRLTLCLVLIVVLLAPGLTLARPAGAQETGWASEFDSAKASDQSRAQARGTHDADIAILLAVEDAPTSSWSPLVDGNELNDGLYALVFDDAGRALYAAGRFTSAGLHAAGRDSDPLYPFTTVYVLMVACLSLTNLWRGYRYDSSEMRRRQFRPLFIATLLAALGGLYITAGIGLGLDLPELPRDIAFGVAVALLGFAVARHNALVEGRVIEADLRYVLMTVGSLTAMAVLLYRGGHVFSFLTLVLVMVVTICVLMLYDGQRTALDRLFCRDQFRQLRVLSQGFPNPWSVRQASTIAVMIVGRRPTRS